MKLSNSGAWPIEARLITVLVLAVCGACGSHTAPAMRRSVAPAPEPCTATLLARTARYDSTSALALVGQYRLVWIDTVSTRGLNRLPPGPRQGPAVKHREFRLWVADTAAARRRASGLLQQSSARLEGAFIGADTTGFGPGRPQLRVGGLGADRLRLVYDPIVYDAVVMDGGILEEDLPIAVAGPWGFGGYYAPYAEFYTVDLDGKRIPPFAGYYCALRVN
jgi:hypothetical protein